MRYFTLFDESGTEFPITTKKCFFHEPGGLGFDEEASYFTVGFHHSLLSSTYSQGQISGDMIFVDDSWEENGKTPYQRGFEFTQFCSNKNLQLYYQPHGEGTDGYYRNVRLSKYDKGEISELGVLEVPIEFTCSTPWYKKVYYSADAEPEVDGVGWIWENTPIQSGVLHGNSTWRPHDYDEDNSKGYITWGQEVRLGFAKIDTAQYGGNILPSPSILIVDGPAISPKWTHFVNNSEVGHGEFASSVTIGAEEQLIIDNTTFPYGMYVRNKITGEVTRDVYQLQNFNYTGFIELQTGLNVISVQSTASQPPKVVLEGRLYYGSV